MHTSKQHTKRRSTDDENTKMVVLNIRHTPGVKSFVDAEAAKSNDFPSAFYRKVFNAGLESLYSIKIENNEIIELPPPRC